jgi:Leucine-rich repeat (LRR) protein
MKILIENVKSQSELNDFFIIEDGISCDRYYYEWYSLDSVWFDNSSFTELPDGLVRSLFLSINVSNVGLLKIKPSDFSYGQNLKVLDLSHNKLKVLEENLFANLTELAKLDLSYNQIELINSEAFKNCCKFLTVFKLQHNKIQKIDSEIFKLLQPKFYDEVYEYHRHTYQQKVDVSENEIIELEISKNVVNLNAANNQIKSLSVEAGSSMWSLNISNNFVDNLKDSGFLYAENLVELDLSNNFLGPLNTSIFSKLTNLEILNLKGTNISNIQLGTFSHQHSLKVLNISDNSLGQLDLHWFLALDRLEEFFISGNRLRKIENLSPIKTIHPDLNKISLSNNDFDCSYLVEIVNLMKLSDIEIDRYDAPPVRHEINFKGIRCVGDVPTEPESPEEDKKVLARNDTSINDLREMLDYRLKYISDRISPNYFLDFLLGAAAFMIIIYTTVKLVNYLKFKSFQGTRLFKLDSLNNDQSDP